MADGKRNDSSYRTVWRGTLVSGGLGALTGGTIAFIQNESMVRYAATMGFNCGIFGATFFVIREAFLHAQRRRNPRFALKDSQTRDYDDLLSSALAGATTGGFVSAIVRGPKSVLTGAFAFGAFCTAGQLLYTTARWYRQELILRKEHTPEPLASKERKGFWDRVNESKWSPIKKISEEEYNERIARRREGLARATHVTDRIEATDGPTDANGTDKE